MSKIIVKIPIHYIIISAIRSKADNKNKNYLINTVLAANR